MQDVVEHCTRCGADLLSGSIVQLTIDGGQLCAECVASVSRITERLMKEYEGGR